MIGIGVDDLHLLNLNWFKHVFRGTIHESLPVSKRKLVADYLRQAHFYSYDAADDGDDPVKRWIGREVQRFCHEADQHLPFLLSLAAGTIDISDDAGVALNAAGEEEMDLAGSAFAPTAQEVQNEMEQPSLIDELAGYWDNYLDWMRVVEEPWTDDSDEYRKQRALAYANGARTCARDLLHLRPTMKTWVPHIACNIVPRQIVALDDSRTRRADAAESYGAVCKKLIKHLTCRRARGPGFSRGYIEQAFRRLVVRSDLRHGAENAPFLQRKDHVMAGTGLQTKCCPHSKSAGPMMSI